MARTSAAPWWNGPLRRAVALALLLAIAKAVLVVIRFADGFGRGLRSGWTPVVFLYEDAWLVATFAAFDLVASRLGAKSPRARVWVGLAMWLVYAAIAVYVAFNVPVARVFGTPLTHSILAAAGGALKDSIVVYFTATNIAAVVALCALAVALARRPKRPALWVVLAIAVVGVAVGVLGPTHAARVDSMGLHRNAVLTIGRTALEHWSPRRTDGALADRGAGDALVRGDGPSVDLRHVRGGALGRNIVWVILESTGARYLRTYGAERDSTPRLTALAERGVVFDHAYCVYPESIKGLYSALCSFAPATSTTADRYAASRLPCTSVAAALQSAGYRTGLFHSGRFIYLGMDDIVQGRGFEHLDDAGAIGGKFESSFGVDDASTARRVLSYVDSLRPGEKLFAVYMPIAGHHPYESPGEGARPFGEATERDRYDSDLYRGDLALGLLIDGIRARGLWNDTIWVVNGDHGEAFYQHEGNFAHTLFVYEENVHVPLIVVAPGLVDRQLHVPQIASLLDIAPTILALAGVPAPSRYEGRSLLEPTPGVARFFADQAVSRMGIRDGDWKGIYEADAGRMRLFDLATDPGEQRDVAAANAERARRYRDDLTAWSARQRVRVLGR